MRISKTNFSADVHPVPGSQAHPAFRYQLYRFIDGEDRLLFESNPFHDKKDCVAYADQHLERVIATHSTNLRVWRSAA